MMKRSFKQSREGTLQNASIRRMQKSRFQSGTRQDGGVQDEGGAHEANISVTVV